MYSVQVFVVVMAPQTSFAPDVPPSNLANKGTALVDSILIFNLFFTDKLMTFPKSNTNASQASVPLSVTLEHDYWY